MEYVANRDPRIEKVTGTLERIKSLPTLPAVATEVMAIARDPERAMRQIEAVILTDPALATKILKVANSPFYGIRREISSLRLALTVLGINQIRSLVVGVSVLKAVNRESGKGFNYEALWEHCTGSAALCRLLARRFGLNFDDEEYVAGLIHDIGKVILDQYLHDEFLQALAEAEEKGEPLEDVERRIIGVDHAFVGAWLARKWGLPESLVEAIGEHHSPAVDSGMPSMAAVVNLADGVARLGTIGESANPYQPKLQDLAGWRILAQSTRDGKIPKQWNIKKALDGERINPDEFMDLLAPDIESARNFAQMI